MLIPEANPDLPGVVDKLAGGRDGADTGDGLGDRHAADLVVLVTDHVAKFPFHDKFDGADAETGAEDPVEGRRISSALKVPENDMASLLVRAFLHFVGHMGADASQADFALAPEP